MSMNDFDNHHCSGHPEDMTSAPVRYTLQLSRVGWNALPDGRVEYAIRVLDHKPPAWTGEQIATRDIYHIPYDPTKDWSDLMRWWSTYFWHYLNPADVDFDRLLFLSHPPAPGFRQDFHFSEVHHGTD